MDFDQGKERLSSCTAPPPLSGTGSHGAPMRIESDSQPSITAVYTDSVRVHQSPSMAHWLLLFG